MANITAEIKKLSEPNYQKFSQKLIPNIAGDRILGVRLPALRQLAKNLTHENPSAVEKFLGELPHFYLEENLLHAFLIEQVGDFAATLALTKKFLPFIDNWAVCDSFAPKIFRKHPNEIYQEIKRWLKSDQPYTVRYGIGLLLGSYLDELFTPAMLDLVTAVQLDDYYVQMMQAWYLTTALIKQPEATLPLIAVQTLPRSIQNKTIQKAIESRQLDPTTKLQLRRFKIDK